MMVYYRKEVEMASAEWIKKQREQIDNHRERLLQELNRLRERERRTTRKAALAVQERIKQLGINTDDIALISGAVVLVLRENREEEARTAAIEEFGDVVQAHVTIAEEASEEEDILDDEAMITELGAAHGV